VVIVIEVILAIGLLGYIILFCMKIGLSKERFEKIIHYSKVTEIIAQIISMIGAGTIILGLMAFISVAVLCLIKSTLWTETLLALEFEKKPIMLFLIVIGAMVITCFPVFLFKFFPYFGEKQE